MNNESRNLSVPLLVQPWPLLTLMMEQLQKACGALGIKPHQTLTCQRRMWMTLTWTQPLETVLYSQIQIKMSMRTVHKKYRKRVWASCRLSKGSLWMEAQLNRINDKHQHMWEHDHESVRTENKCALVEDHNSFEMWKTMVRTSQLLGITEAIGSKICTRELKAKTHDRAKTLVLLLKQYHAHYYQFYEKGTTRAMVGL